MNETGSLSRENFILLLCWLDKDENIAAEKYEKIRKRLIRVFSGRGCYEPDILADNTIDRVARKSSELIENYVGEPEGYFYGVAKNIYFEWSRKQKPVSQLNDRILSVQNDVQHPNEAEYTCLEKCLEGLVHSDRRLIVEYYCDEKRAKIERRKLIADGLGISAGALQLRVYRLRTSLHTCVKKCADAI